MAAYADVVIARGEFPDSTIGVIDGNGNDLVDRLTGVTVKLWARNKYLLPFAAEVCSADDHSDDEVIGTVIHLTYDDNDRLVDYDGVTEIPNEVLTMLKQIGVDVSEI